MTPLITKSYSNAGFVSSIGGYPQRSSLGCEKRALLDELHQSPAFEELISRYPLREDVQDNIIYEYDCSGNNPCLSLKLKNGRKIAVPYTTLCEKLPARNLEIIRKLLELTIETPTNSSPSSPRSPARRESLDELFDHSTRTNSRSEGSSSPPLISTSNDKMADLFERLFTKQQENYTGIIQLLINSLSNLPLSSIQPWQYCAQTQQSQIDQLLKEIVSLKNKQASLEEQKQRKETFEVSVQTDDIRSVSESENTDLNNQIEQLNTEKEQLTQNLLTIENQKIDLAEITSKANVKLREKDFLIQSYQSDLNKQVLNNQELTNQFLDSQESIRNLQETLTNLESSHSAHASEIEEESSLQNQIDQLIRSLENTQNSSSELEKNFKAISLDLANSKERESGLNTLLQNTQLASETALKNLRDNLQVIEEQLERIKNQENAIAGYSNENTELRVQSEYLNEQLETAEKAKTELQNQLQTVQNKSKIEIERLSKEIEEQILLEHQYAFERLNDETEILFKNAEDKFNTTLDKLQQNHSEELVQFRTEIETQATKIKELTQNLLKALQSQERNGLDLLNLQELNQQIQNELTQTQSTLETEKLSHQVQIEALKNQAAVDISSLTAMETLIKELQNKLECLAGHLDTANEREAQAQNAIAENIETLTQIKADLFKEKISIEALRTQHIADLCEVAAFIQTKLQAQIDQLKIEKETLQKEGSEALSKLQADFDSHMQTSGFTIEGLNKAILEQQKTLEETTATLNNLTDTVIPGLVKDNNVEMAALRNELINTKQQLTRAQNELKEKQTLELKIDQQFEKLTIENKKLKEQLVGEAALKQKIQFKELEIQEKIEEIEQLRIDQKEAEQKFNQKLNQKDSDINLLNSQVKDKDKELNRRQATVEHLNKEIKELEAAKFDLEFKLEKQKESTRIAQNKGKRVEGLQEELSKLDLELQIKQSELEKETQLRRNVESQLKNISKLKTELQEAQNNLAVSNQSLKSLEEQFLNLKNKSRKEINSAVDELNKTIALEKEKNEGLAENISKLSVQLATAKKERESVLVNEKLMKAEAELALLEADLDNYENENIALERQYQINPLNHRSVTSTSSSSSSSSSVPTIPHTNPLIVTDAIVAALEHESDIKRKFKDLIKNRKYDNQVTRILQLSQDLSNVDRINVKKYKTTGEIEVFMRSSTKSLILGKDSWKGLEVRKREFYKYLHTKLASEITKASKSDHLKALLYTFHWNFPTLCSFLSDLNTLLVDNHKSGHKSHLKAGRKEDADITANAFYSLLTGTNVHPYIYGELIFLKTLLDQVKDETESIAIIELRKLYNKMEPLLRDMFGDLDLSEQELQGQGKSNK